MGARLIVAAPGPSLTLEVAALCRGHDVLVINDAWRMFTRARWLYACDARWWMERAPRPHEFEGERWTCVSDLNMENEQIAIDHKLKVVRGEPGDVFSTKPGHVNLGYCWPHSGFQAVNLAINVFGARHIVLVGFDMRRVGGKSHYFGEYPHGYISPDLVFDAGPMGFSIAAEALPLGVRIVNTTLDSAITCFQKMSVSAALAEK